MLLNGEIVFTFTVKFGSSANIADTVYNGVGVGTIVGIGVGMTGLGFTDGATVGFTVGTGEGTKVGFGVGLREAIGLGNRVGLGVGIKVGLGEGVGLEPPQFQNHSHF